MLLLVLVGISLTMLLSDISVKDNEEDFSEKKSVAGPQAERLIDLSGSERADIVKLAKKQVGIVEQLKSSAKSKSIKEGLTPYHVWGADLYHPDGGGKSTWRNPSETYWDYWCTLFVEYLGYQVGCTKENFPRGLASVYRTSQAYDGGTANGLRYSVNVSGRRSSTKGSKSSWKAGWLVLLKTSRNSNVNHIAIYVGNDTFIHGNSNGPNRDQTKGVYALKSDETFKHASFVYWAKPYYRSTITYITNGGTINSSSVVNNKTKYVEEKDKSLVSKSNITKSNDTFQGWYSNSSFTGQAVTSILASDEEWGNKTFYAKWANSPGLVPEDPPPPPTDEIKYNIIYETYGGVINDSSYPSTFKEGEVVSFPMNVSKLHYRFAGWYMDKSANSNGPYSSTDASWKGDVYLYARWIPVQYDVYLYADGGTINGGGYSYDGTRYHKKYTYGVTEPLPTASMMYKRGHDFSGWCKDSSRSGALYTSIAAGEYGTQYYYAKWTPKEYEVILHLNGGTVINPRIDNAKYVDNNTIMGTYTYGVGVTLPKVPGDIYKDNVAFAGWFEDGGIKRVESIGTDEIDPREYWAKWVTIEMPSELIGKYAEVIQEDVIGHANNKIQRDKLCVYIYEIRVKGTNELLRRDCGKVVFRLDLNGTNNFATSSEYVKVYLSESSATGNTRPRGLNWPFITTSSVKRRLSNNVYQVSEKGIGTYIIPNNILNDMRSGDRKVYLHVVTDTGDETVRTVSVIRRIIYVLH